MPRDNRIPEDVLINRGEKGIGFNSVELISKLTGGKIVEMTPFEPDASTHRDEWYYNTSENMLYRKVVVVNKPKQGIIRAYWKPALTI